MRWPLGQRKRSIAFCAEAIEAIWTKPDWYISRKLSSHPKGTRGGKIKKRPVIRYGKNTTPCSDLCGRGKIVSSGWVFFHFKSTDVQAVDALDVRYRFDKILVRLWEITVFQGVKKRRFENSRPVFWKYFLCRQKYVLPAPVNFSLKALL